MTPFLPELSPPALEALASAVETGRLRVPYVAGSVAQYVPDIVGSSTAGALTRLVESGMGEDHVATVLRLIAAERRETQRLLDRVELVWSGPETVGSTSRETSVVVRGLFQNARSSVLVASYAFDRPKTEEAKLRAQMLFSPLAENMDRHPELLVRFVVNIARPYPTQQGSEKPDPILVQEFAEAFRRDLWPGMRPPEVYFDPRALLSWDARQRSSMHAKCLAVDDEWLFITSANFTQAAQARNIEAGVLIQDPQAARALRFQMESLISGRGLQRVAML